MWWGWWRRGDHGELRLALAGPAGLDRLDEVTVAILDEVDADHWARGFPTGVSEQDARRSPRTVMRYVKPGDEAVAEVTSLLGPPRRSH